MTFECIHIVRVYGYDHALYTGEGSLLVAVLMSFV